MGIVCVCAFTFCASFSFEVLLFSPYYFVVYLDFSANIEWNSTSIHLRAWAHSLSFSGAEPCGSLSNRIQHDNVYSFR
jgi:hypothetical protein